MTGVQAAESVGYKALVQGNANFRNLWLGQIISLLGDWFNLIASAALVALLTQSGMAVGGLFVVRMLAQFIASPIGGVLADRFNRKHLLILTDIVRAFTVLGFLLVREPGDVWLMYILTSVQMAFAGIFFPTRNAILQDVVNQGEIGAANALTSATWSTMLAFGAALGGLVAGEWGITPAFVIDSGTFLLSALFISRIQYTSGLFAESNQHAEAGTKNLNIFAQYAEGLRYLNQHKDIWVLSLQKASMALGVTSAFQIIQVSLASNEFVLGEGGSTSLGLFYAFVGIGTGVGPILTRSITGDDQKRLRQTIAVGYLVAGGGLLIVSTLANFPVALLGTLLRGFGVAMGWVFSTQLLLLLVPNQVLGRVFSTEYAILTLANAIGAGIGGWAIDNLPISIPQMLWIMAGVTLSLGIFWALAGLLRLSEPPGTS
jgi:MFS family permease